MKSVFWFINVFIVFIMSSNWVHDVHHNNKTEIIIYHIIFFSTYIIIIKIDNSYSIVILKLFILKVVKVIHVLSFIFVLIILIKIDIISLERYFYSKIMSNIVSPYKNIKQHTRIKLDPYHMNSDIRNNMKIVLKKKS